jgi:DDE superfamily endonuclease
MPTPASAIISLLAPWATAFTAPAFRKACILIAGTILAPGRRTVCAALRACGLQASANAGRYHRLLSRDRWSPLRLSRLLLERLVEAFVPPGAPLVLLADDTLERRRGKQIRYKGWFRDPVRSTGNKAVFTLGIRWFCVCLLVAVPWSSRPWALPFFVVPSLSEKTCLRLKKRHRSSVQWLQVALTKLCRWLPGRSLVVVGDGGFAAVELFATCQAAPQPVRLVVRLRLDAALYAPPGPQPKGKRGPKPKKGARQPNLKARLADPQTPWQRVTVRWYGGQQKSVELATGVSLWHTPRQDPVRLRWVLVRPVAGDPKPFPPGALACSDSDVAAVQILQWFVGRWNIEVTFEELRAQLGFETQRQWSPRAIGRTTPCLFGVFSLVVWLAKPFHPEELPCQRASWYRKDEATFSDLLAVVRWRLWGGENYEPSGAHPDHCLIPLALLQGLRRVACYTA